MKYGRYIIKSLNIPNLFLLAACFYFFFEFISPLLKSPLGVIVPAPQKTALNASARGVEEESNLSVTDYSAIGERNLFHPERRIPPEKTGNKDSVSLPKPELILHGVLITDRAKVAFVQDKKAGKPSTGRSGRQTTLKEGDTVGGYTLRSIGEREIILTGGNERMTVSLDDVKERAVETAPSGRVPGTSHMTQTGQHAPAAQPFPVMPPPDARQSSKSRTLPAPIMLPERTSAPQEPQPGAVPMQTLHHIKRP